MFHFVIMDGCLLCGELLYSGGLCEKHAADLRGDGDITAEQISSRELEEPLGWLIDQWGRTHPLEDSTTIGRTPGVCHLLVMHHSVSSRHARITARQDYLYMVDLRSMNGTYMNGQRIEEARLYNGDCMTLGNISFYFIVRATPASTLPYGVGGTVPTNVARTLSVRLAWKDHEVDVLERGDSGLLRMDTQTLDLTRLEFALLRALVQPALEYDDPAMHYVPTRTLLRSLDFRSMSPTGENLRELVRRLRVKLSRIGMKSIVESKRGVGYRIRGTITPSD